LGVFTEEERRRGAGGGVCGASSAALAPDLGVDGLLAALGVRGLEGLAGNWNSAGSEATAAEGAGEPVIDLERRRSPTGVAGFTGVSAAEGLALGLELTSGALASASFSAAAFSLVATGTIVDLANAEGF